MKDMDEMLHDFNKALKSSMEKQMTATIKKEFPDVKNFTVTFNTNNKSWFIVGLTPEQEAHLKAL